MLVVSSVLAVVGAYHPCSAVLLDPTVTPVSQFVRPLVIPPVMPRVLPPGGGPGAQTYRIAMRQFQQQILPEDYPMTTVWSYGPQSTPMAQTGLAGGFHAPSFTIEATRNVPIRVFWYNELVDNTGNFRPHLLAVDQTLHWANPPGPRDMRGSNQAPYVGPVPIVTHLHGGHVGPKSDGFPEAWFLPNAKNIPAGYYKQGTHYGTEEAAPPGAAAFHYPNDQRETTLWYHDHALGMTRLNVYAGPAGFYLIRGPQEAALKLPGPAPKLGDAPGTKYYEIPLAIQDRSFHTNGTLWYPDNRAFFEGLTLDQLQIPFIPDEACGGLQSDISPIWNPEFFGNTMMVNGRTWPYLQVEKRRYRFRFLNGCNSRFLILKFSNNMPFHQIGTEGGLLPSVVTLSQLLMSPAERADVIVDFTNVPVGTQIILQNLGPDEPFGGGTPGVDFDPANPATTGKVMRFDVVAATGPDNSTAVGSLVLPNIPAVAETGSRRDLSLNENVSETVFVKEEGGNIVLSCADGEPFGPQAALLGTMNAGLPVPLKWMDPITENPKMNATERWYIHNFTEDAHPIHLHMVMFRVVRRIADDGAGASRPPEAWEGGWKDTVIAYPGEVTVIQAKFDNPGLFVWHCHIVEHEDNEMMRPYFVGPMPPGMP
jgi:FtsP/CotA-like multicopper oxidase with cupredoxin domain